MKQIANDVLLAAGLLGAGLLMWIIAAPVYSQTCIGGPDDVPCVLTSVDYTAIEKGDLPIPVFSNSSGDVHLSAGRIRKGYINKGLSAWQAGPFTQDKPDLLRLVLQYFPPENMPRAVTFDVEIQNVENFQHREGLRWRMGDQAGTVDGLSIEGLELAAGERQALWIEPSTPRDPPLVLSRMPMHDEPIPVGDLVLPGASNWQHGRDVARMHGWLAEGDLAIYDNGEYTILEDCTGDPDTLCLAQEPAVSPDGKRIAYSYGTGTETQRVTINRGPMTDMIDFMIKTSEIRIYNTETGETTTVRSGPWRDWSPAWASNNLLVMASDKEGHFPNFAERAKGEITRSYVDKGSQIWRIRPDGSEAVNLTPHEQAAMNPWVMSNGEVCYSTWQGHGEAALGHSSPRNIWPILCMDINGENVRPDLGWHGSPTLKTRVHYLTDIVGGEGATVFKALRPVGEIRKGVRSATTYYRGNSGGDNGAVVLYAQSEAEGALRQTQLPESVYQRKEPGSGRYVNQKAMIATPYAQDQDLDEPRYEKNAPFRPAGRAGGAAAYTNDNWIYVHNVGHCYEGAPLAGYKKMAGEDWCRREIREALVDRITNPFDPKQTRIIASSPDHHLWNPRVIATYQERIGIPTPDIAPLKDLEGDKAILGIVDLTKGELFRLQNASDEKFPGQKQANVELGYHAIVDRFCVIYVELWDKLPTRLGYQSTGPKVCTSKQSDGSVGMILDANRTFLMTAEDAEGKEVGRDRRPDSVRPGETRTCHGCHDGHSAERLAQIEGTAEERFWETMAGKELARMLSRTE